MSSGYVWTPTSEAAQAATLSAFLTRLGLSDKAELQARAFEEPSWFWDSLLKYFDVRFRVPYDKVLDLSEGFQRPKWCVGGRVNLVDNCLQKHRGSATWEKPAVLWEGENGHRRQVSYRELATETSRIAQFLVSSGVRRGDVVALYIPMVPEAAAAFLAIAWIGAIAMPLFSGFGPHPLRERLTASRARAIITADGTYRRGKTIPLKDVADEAAHGLDHLVTMIVLKNTGGDVRMQAGRDHWWHDAPEASDAGEEIADTDAETPAMLMFTSGTTGVPKGTVHTHCGLLGKNILDLGLCVDLKPDDRLFWMSDMGWIVGPKVIISSTFVGATIVMIEGAPDYPDGDRIWRTIQRDRVTIFGQAPTGARQMMRAGAERVRAHDLTSLRATVSSGEPWTEDAWLWFFRTVCDSRIPILNYAGGTECGGAILIGTFHDPLKPCAFGGPVPGMGADIVNGSGQSLPPGETGDLVLRRPSIGLSRGLWKDPKRFIESYWSTIPGVWVQGDLARRDDDGLWYLLGRSDDTIKIAGKRTGPSEIETLILNSGVVGDVAVVGVPDPVTGSALVCVCVPGEDHDSDEATAERVRSLVATQFGRPYMPKQVLFVPQLPKTRNQKIVRRVIRSVLSRTEMGDLGALANPEAIEDIKTATVF